MFECMYTRETRRLRVARQAVCYRNDGSSLVLFVNVFLIFLLLSFLQNNIKRDPPAYFGEFQLQFSHLDSQLAVLKEHPQRTVKGLQQLLMFLAHVCTYTSDLHGFLSFFSLISSSSYQSCLVSLSGLLDSPSVFSHAHDFTYSEIAILTTCVDRKGESYGYAYDIHV